MKYCFYNPMHQLITGLLILFSLGACANKVGDAPTKPDLLFIFFDAGETNAMTPVLAKLKNENKSFLVLTFGTSSTLKLDEKLSPEYVINSERVIDLDVDRNWNRYKGLPQEQIKRIKETFSPKTIITGVSSVIQQQLTEAYQGEAKIIGYFDNYGPMDNISYASIVREIEKNLDTLMVPSKDVAATAEIKNVVVVGQPSLEASIASFRHVDNDAVFKKTGLLKNRKVVSFMGGYDPEYKDVLTVFVQGMTAFPDYQTVLRPHPKTDGSLEQRVIDEQKCGHCVVSQTDMTTTEAVAISDVVVCHHSTVGIQAIFLGKKVIYVEVPGATFTNPDLSAWHFSKQVTTPQDFVAVLKERQGRVRPKEELFTIAGIPTNATENIYQLLTK